MVGEHNIDLLGEAGAVPGRTLFAASRSKTRMRRAQGIVGPVRGNQ